MQTIMERNRNGEVFVDGKFVARIPHNQSAMGFLADGGAICNGEDYTVDEDWVYFDGKPIRKQLHYVCGQDCDGSRVRVWNPNIFNTGKLESRYWNQVQFVRKFHQNKWRPSFQAIVDNGGQAHVKPTHKFKGDQDSWWLYDADDKGIGFKWVDCPKNPINLELGKKFYNLDRYSNSVYKRMQLFRLALENSFLIQLDKFTGSRNGYVETDGHVKPGKQICFNVNGRQYWYHTKYNRNLALRWNILSWPEDNCDIITIQT